MILTRDACVKYILQQALHSARVEYYVAILGIDSNDIERPHDLVGKGNKFERDVMRGLAVDTNDLSLNLQLLVKREIIDPALKLHRQQYHHRIFNGEFYQVGVSHDNLRLAAVDVVCSLLEDRPFSGGSHSFDEIKSLESITTNPRWKYDLISEALEQMKQVPAPNLEGIGSLKDFPKEIPGLSKVVCDKIRGRVLDALLVMRRGLLS